MKIKINKQRENKYVKTKWNKTKSPLKYNYIHFAMANYSCIWGLPYCVVDILSETTLEKTNFLFASGYRLQMASWLGTQSHLAWICIGFMYTAIVWVLKYVITVVSGRNCLFGVTLHLWLLGSFCLLFHIVPWALNGRVWWWHLVCEWVCQSHLLLHVVQS